MRRLLVQLHGLYFRVCAERKIASGAKFMSIECGATEANFADYFARIADYQRMRRNIVDDDRACADQGIWADRRAADDGNIGADGGAAHYTGGQECIAIPADERARTKIVREYGIGSDEYAVFQSDKIPESNAVFNRTVRADRNFIFDENIFAQITIRADLTAGQNVGEGPDSGACADLLAFANGLFVDKIIVGDDAHKNFRAD